MRRLGYRLLRALFWLLFKSMNRLDVVHGERFPEYGGVIVAANHVSYLDPLVVGVAVKRQVTFMAKESLFRVPLIGALIGLYSLPVRRGRPNPSAIKEAVQRLKRGEVIVIFPEGGIREEGLLTDAKRGVGMISRISNAPVVPVFIKGTDRALPVNARFIRPAKVRVIFGESVGIREGKTGKDYHARVLRDIREAIKGLRYETRSGGLEAFGTTRERVVGGTD